MRSSFLRFATAVALLLMTSAALQAQDATQDSTPPASQPPPSAPHRIRIGGNVQAAKLKFQPLPIYPEIAKTARISGTVILHVIIAKDGSVQEVQFISGPPLLMRSAMNAVKQWKYEPTTLNGEPVEVDTTISVVFTLGGSAQSPATPPASGAAAQSPIASASPIAAADIDPQLKADILHFLDVTHAVDRSQTAGRAAFETLRPQLLAAMPNTPNREKIVTVYSEKLVSLFQGAEFTDRLVAIYAKYFSDDDVKALAQFYETPAGQHFNDHMSDVMTDGMKVGQQLAAENLQRIFSELCREYPELQGQAQFCQASSDKKSQLFPPALPTTSAASAALN
jgi:TonB family protein